MCEFTKNRVVVKELSLCLLQQLLKSRKSFLKYQPIAVHIINQRFCYWFTVNTLKPLTLVGLWIWFGIASLAKGMCKGPAAGSALTWRSWSVCLAQISSWPESEQVWMMKADTSLNDKVRKYASGRLPHAHFCASLKTGFQWWQWLSVW